MAITNKLITFNKLTSFETQLAQGNILETSIVFIKDAKKIWTKGTYFDCSGGGSGNIAVYETTDDVYNGVLNNTTELTQLLINDSIYTLIIVQKTTTRLDKNVFIFNVCKSPMVKYKSYNCIFTDTNKTGVISNPICYQIEVNLEVHTYSLTKQELALKSDIPNTDNFATQANLSSAVTQLTTNIAKKQDKLVSGTNIATINGNSILGSGNFNLATTDLLRSFQPKLESGTNIKTINGNSILGSGDIEISGGGSSSGSAAYPEVNHGTSDTVLSLAPNTFHIWDEVESLQLVYKRPTEGIANEYLFQFTSGATATTLYLPDTIKWVGGSAPTIQPNMIYQISILNDLGSVLEFDNAPELIENIGTYNEGSFMSGATLTFQYPVESDLTIYFSGASSNSFTLSKGNTTLNIDWYEPSAPIITGISPTSDNIYKYVI